MKLSLTFLALAVATVQADLTTKWNLALGESAQEGDLYTFTYIGIGSEMTLLWSPGPLLRPREAAKCSFCLHAGRIPEA